MEAITSAEHADDLAAAEAESGAPMDGLTEAAGVGDLEDDFILSVLDGGMLPNGAIDEAGESEDEEGTDMVRRLETRACAHL